MLHLPSSNCMLKVLVGDREVKRRELFCVQLLTGDSNGVLASFYSFPREAKQGSDRVISWQVSEL